LRIERLETFLKIFLPLIQLAKLLKLRNGKAGADIGKQRDFYLTHPVVHNEDKKLFGVGGAIGIDLQKLKARCLINTRK